MIEAEIPANALGTTSLVVAMGRAIFSLLAYRLARRQGNPPCAVAMVSQPLGLVKRSVPSSTPAGVAESELRAAVDPYDVAVDPAGLIGGKEGDDIAHIVRLADASRK